MEITANIYWISGSVALLVIIALLFRKRRKSKGIYSARKKHPSGLLKYHPDTETKIKLSIEKSNHKETKFIACYSVKGDVKASFRASLKKVIDEMILNKNKIKEVVIQVESPGGGVAEYGHVYAEMCRLKEAGIVLSVCIDTVAASGGYLMSLPATKIMAAPFAIVGSIGVVSFIPNIRGLLKNLKIEPRTFTAGQYKRTLTLTDDAGPEEVKHYQEQLELIHDQFKKALKKHRPQVNLDQVATGEHWLAESSVDKELNLVDEIKVSSDYLMGLNKNNSIIEFSVKEKKSGPLKFLKRYFMGYYNDNFAPQL